MEFELLIAAHKVVTSRNVQLDVVSLSCSKNLGSSSPHCFKQPAAVVAVAAEHDRSGDGNGEAKAQPSGDAAIRACRQFKQLGLGPRQTPAFAFGDHIAQKGDGRLLAPPRMARRAVKRMALPCKSRTGQHVVRGAGGTLLQGKDAKSAGAHYGKRGNHAIETGGLVSMGSRRTVASPGRGHDQPFDTSISVEVGAGKEDMLVPARAWRCAIGLMPREKPRQPALAVPRQRHQSSPDRVQQRLPIGHGDVCCHWQCKDHHVAPSVPGRRHQAEAQIAPVTDDQRAAYGMCESEFNMPQQLLRKARFGREGLGALSLPRERFALYPDGLHACLDTRMAQRLEHRTCGLVLLLQALTSAFGTIGKPGRINTAADRPLRQGRRVIVRQRRASTGPSMP
jgi:hypothetical protein